jgi:hypothetical protein
MLFTGESMKLSVHLIREAGNIPIISRWTARGMLPYPGATLSVGIMSRASDRCI